MIERLRRSRSAKVERERTYDEKKLRREEIDNVLSDLSSEDTDQVLSRFSRRTFLIRSGKLGAGVVVGAAGAGLIGGYNFGVQNGAADERGRNYPRGALSPELRSKLATASVIEIQGFTAASLRDAQWPVPDFPFPIPDGGANPENTPSKNKWIAIGPGGLYLPLREGDDTVGDFSGAVSRANTAAGQIDSKLTFKQGDLSDFLEAEIASLSKPGGQTIFQAGHVATSHQVEVDGIKNGIAIGRTTPTDPLSYITFDASQQAPLPVGVSAGGFVGAK